MKIECFVCASQLYPDDSKHDQQLHIRYLESQRKTIPSKSIELIVIQNGCCFPTSGIRVIRNPFVKSLAYNWLLCDANCSGDYWVFVPEDCHITPDGWKAIQRHTTKGKTCFALSRDPKVIICQRGIFAGISDDLKILCDMNFLGKEIGCVVLREELHRQGLHCISKNWKKVSRQPDRWGNEFYREINLPEHPDINKSLKLPLLQDYGFDGWKASIEELEATFLKIVGSGLDRHMEAARRLKNMIARNGPRISEVPYKGILSDLRDRILRL